MILPQQAGTGRTVRRIWRWKKERQVAAAAHASKRHAEIRKEIVGFSSGKEKKVCFTFGWMCHNLIGEHEKQQGHSISSTNTDWSRYVSADVYYLISITNMLNSCKYKLLWQYDHYGVYACALSTEQENKT